MLELSRRSFLTSVAVSGAVLGVLGPGEILRDLCPKKMILDYGAVGDGSNDTYYMRPGEILRDLHLPNWARIVATDHCQIIGGYFRNTQITCTPGASYIRIVGNYFNTAGLAEGEFLINL